MSRGLLCECGARRSDGSRRWCAQCHEATSGVEAATSPWWRDADGVLARVRGDAAVVREIISLRGFRRGKPAASSATGSRGCGGCMTGPPLDEFGPTKKRRIARREALIQLSRSMEHDHGSCDSHAVGGGDSCYRDRLAVPVLMVDRARAR
jgi:hypothetical protein